MTSRVVRFLFLFLLFLSSMASHQHFNSLLSDTTYSPQLTLLCSMPIIISLIDAFSLSLSLSFSLSLKCSLTHKRAHTQAHQLLRCVSSRGIIEMPKSKKSIKRSPWRGKILQKLRDRTQARWITNALANIHTPPHTLIDTHTNTLSVRERERERHSIRDHFYQRVRERS